MPFATKFLIGSVLFFVGALGAAAFMFFGGGNIVSSRNIELQIIAPSLIDGGKEATLEIIIQNNNRTPLELADLTIDYPEGTRDPKDLTRTLSHERQSVGTVESGAQLKKTAHAVFYGGEGTQQKVHVALEYTIAGSNAIFVKEGEVNFVIGSSPVSLTVEAPKEAVAGEPFPITITVQSNAAAPVEHVLLEGQYPFGFTLLEASPSAEVGGLLWRLGTMQPGSSKKIRLEGVIDASEGDERVFRFLVGSDADETNTRIRVPFIVEPFTLTVQKPSIAGSISVEGKSGKNISAPVGKVLQGEVAWQNNLNEAISDLELTLHLEGPMLEESSVSAQNGFYNSNDRSITWTKAQDPSLAHVSPGQGGELSFAFSTELPGQGDTLYTNPTVNLSLTIRGERTGGENGSGDVSSSASAQVTLASDISLMSEALHFEGPFQNSGPMPPTVGEDTSYTVVWTVRNSSNTIGSAAVATNLPPYVRFVAGSAGSSISFDAASRTVRWDLGDLAAGVGYSSPERQASFQIVLTPSASQAGEAPALTGVSVLTGQDRFAQVPVSTSAGAVTTALPSDGDFDDGMEIVGN
jgi:hypothetical protein